MPNTQFKPAFPTNNGLAPPNKRGLAIPVVLDFSKSQQYSFDLVTAIAQNNIKTLQSIFIDNSLNSQRVVIQFGATQQKLVCPPNSQGVFPVLGQVQGTAFAASGINATVNTAPYVVFGGLCYIWVLDVPMPTSVWSTKTNNVIANSAINDVLTSPLTGSTSLFVATTLLPPNAAANRLNYTITAATITLYSGTQSKPAWNGLQVSYYLQPAASVNVNTPYYSAIVTGSGTPPYTVTLAPPVVSAQNYCYTGEVCMGLLFTLGGAWANAVLNLAYTYVEVTDDTQIPLTGIINPT